ncbi:MAG: HIT family protein [Firmicutes bacterium HGW-Firmicutes-1]|jgi:histidine triad (HIT) family protein|nr:MAG: HIT family protein [Firmicutes bacterium HGW-Firmicutes-1]
MSQQKCVFCSIVSGEIPSATIYENSEFKVILDVFPSGVGHTLIFPKEHFENIYDLDAETARKLFAFVTMVARALKKVLNCDGMNILQNNGEIAGQTVFHFHMHLIPRFAGDGLKFNWPTKKFTQEEMDNLALEIGSNI